MFVFLILHSSLVLDCNQCGSLTSEKSVGVDSDYPPPPPLINPYRRASYLSQKEIAIERSRKISARLTEVEIQQITETDAEICTSNDQSQQQQQQQTQSSEKSSQYSQQHPQSIEQEQPHKSQNLVFHFAEHQKKAVKAVAVTSESFESVSTNSQSSQKEDICPAQDHSQPLDIDFFEALSRIVMSAKLNSVSENGSVTCSNQPREFFSCLIVL